MQYPTLMSERDDRTSNLRSSLPDVLEAYDDLSERVCGNDGVLKEREKHLVAVALAIASRCDPSVRKRFGHALAAGVEPREIVEVLGITIFMGGDIAAAYAPQALALLESSNVQEQLDLTCLRREKKA